ncbi:CBS domain-containing protein [Halomicrococcus sp. NG-SE-24]|uniref:CBS domain-containing protein n=1 Tax=Halomicrococcus sp. NG-SE-24 TaxID=3436928 RepID=UPI003D95639B
MPVSDIAVTEVVTADRNTAVTAIAARMEEANVGSVLVLEESDLVGIVTDREIALSLADDPDATDRTADEVMTEDPVTVPSDASVTELVRRMEDAGVRRMPVVDDGDLTGIVTLDDVLVLLTGEFDDVVEVVKRQSPRF